MKTLIGTGVVLLCIVGGLLGVYLFGCLLVWEKPFAHKDYYFDSGQKIGIGFFVACAIGFIIFIGYNVGNSIYS